jgi:hypothetical protein
VACAELRAFRLDLRRRESEGAQFDGAEGGAVELELATVRCGGVGFGFLVGLSTWTLRGRPRLRAVAGVAESCAIFAPFSFNCVTAALPIAEFRSPDIALVFARVCLSL